MAIPQTSGPAFIYVARLGLSGTVGLWTTPAANQLYFIGTCEQPPVLQLNPQWEPVMNDIGGSLLPIEYSFQGEDGLVSGVFNKWNELVYKQLASHGLVQGPSARGTERWDDIGTLSQTEGITFQCLIAFPYAAKAVYAANSMPVGMRFLACRLANHGVFPGTRAGRRQFIFHADRALLENSGASGVSGATTARRFTLYDHDLTNVPLVPPILSTGLVSLG